MQEEKTRINIYQLIWNCLKWLLERVIHLTIVFVRMTIYWIVKLLYKIFRLREIDIERERARFSKQEALTSVKHEFTFDRSEEFITEWIYLKEFVFSLDLEEDEKEELFDYILRIIAQSEREAFNTTYNYMITKNMREPSFEDMIIQNIFKTDANIEPRAKVENPYYTDKVSQLRNERNRRKNDAVDEAKARGIF
jgi:hypothetical protein